MKRASHARQKHDPPRWIGLMGWLARHRQTRQAFLFISYCRADQKAIAPILAVLGKEAALWIDQRNLAVGGRWSAEIVDAIRRSKAVLLFCSAAAFKSNDVLREVARAGQFDKPILPLQLDDKPIPDEFLYYLSIHQLISLRDPNWQTHLIGSIKLLFDPDLTRQMDSAPGVPFSAEAADSPAPEPIS